jgi:MFS family permease
MDEGQHGTAWCHRKQTEDSVSKRRMAFAVILSSAVGTLLVYCVVQPTLTVLAAHFGEGRGEHLAQLAATIPAIGMLIGGLVSGWLIALLGRRPIILAAIAGLGILGVAEAYLPNASLFLLDRLALGFGSSLFGTACVTLLGDLYEGPERDKAVGVLQGVGTFGSVPAILLVGVVAHIWGWEVPFYLFVLFAIPAFVLAVISIEGTGGPTAQHERSAPDLSGGLSAIRLWPIYVLVFLINLLSTMGLAQLPFLLKSEGLSDTTLQSIIFSSEALAMGIGAVFSAPIQGRFGERMALIGSVVVAGLCDVAVGLTHNQWVSSAGSVASCLGFGVLLSMAYTLVLNRATPEERGVAVGYVQAAMFIGQFANPVLLAPINGMVGQHQCYIGVGVLALIVALLSGAISGGRTRRELNG